MARFFPNSENVDLIVTAAKKLIASKTTKRVLGKEMVLPLSKVLSKKACLLLFLNLKECHLMNSEANSAEFRDVKS